MNRIVLIPAIALLLILSTRDILGEEGSMASPDAARGIARVERQILVTMAQKSPPRVRRAGSTPKSYGRSGRYKTSSRARRTTTRLARDYGLLEVADWPIEVLGLHCVVFEVPPQSSRDEILERLEDDRRVDSAQPMQLFETLAVAYDDPYLPLQHGFESMQILDAHRWSLGKGVRVAVVDTGVDRDHPELAARIAAAKDFVDDDPRRSGGDRHGTAVAGVIASAADNGIGIVGIAPDVRLLALRACWEVAGENGSLCSSFTLAKALAFAVERRPDVLNLSLGGPPDPLLERLVRTAIERGVVVVAAAGDPEDLTPRFAESIPNVLAVRATRAEGAEPAGAETPADLSLLAPGTDIVTTTPDASFDFLSGSSFAAAHVTGLAALLLEREPGLTPAAIHAILAASYRVVLQPGGVSARVIDACAALARLDPTADCPAHATEPAVDPSP